MQAIDKLKDKDRLSKMPTPAEVVGARLLAAYDALSSAAAPLASNISNATSAAVGMTKIPLQALASQLQSAAAVGQRYTPSFRIQLHHTFSLRACAHIDWSPVMSLNRK